MFDHLISRQCLRKILSKQTLAGSARLSKRLIKICATFALLTAALNLSACGRTGDLYLPDQTAHHTTTKGN